LRGPRVETRGYFLASLTGLTLVAPLISGLNPGLFSVALSGLQEWRHVVVVSGLRIPDSPCSLGAAPVAALRIERVHVVAPGRRLEHVPVHARGWILPASSVPRWRGWPPKAAGGGFEPRNFGQGMQICPTPFGVGPLGLSGIPCSPSTGLPIRSERGHAVAPRANSVPQGRKKIAPAFNPRIRVTHTSGSVRDKRRRDSRRVRIESRRDERE